MLQDARYPLRNSWSRKTGLWYLPSDQEIQVSDICHLHTALAQIEPFIFYHIMNWISSSLHMHVFRQTSAFIISKLLEWMLLPSHRLCNEHVAYKTWFVLIGKSSDSVSFKICCRSFKKKKKKKRDTYLTIS